jgi:hypothetical protein
MDLKGKDFNFFIPYCMLKKKMSLKNVQSEDYQIVTKKSRGSMSSNKSQHEHPFYGYSIYRHSEQQYIINLLKKYKGQAVTEELKKKIWNELQQEKYLGKIKIPFKIAVRLDPTGKFLDYIEVILDTKV